MPIEFEPFESSLWSKADIQKILNDLYAAHVEGKPTVVEGITLYNVHDPSACELQEGCVVHAPTDHHMRGWPLVWRDDKGVFERMCPHGVGHPDVDDARYLVNHGKEALTIHGCEGCCHKSVAEAA